MKISESTAEESTAEDKQLTAESIQLCDNKTTTDTEVDPVTQLPTKIIENICRGFPVLIPYDKSNLYTPALLEGHHAHWALIHGIILPTMYQSVFCCEEGRLESCVEAFSPESEVVGFP